MNARVYSTFALTTVISLPAAFRNAFVQRTFLGLRFILERTVRAAYL